MSFYRIYRPNVIDEIDNDFVRERITELSRKELPSLPHAYLFTGTRGVGKTTAARVIAKLFNCTSHGKKRPCGQCDQCVSIAINTNLDVLEIDAASNRGIDEIRELRSAINLAPVAAAYKVYIIDEVHMLTTEAFNALLKTLEEPPPHAIFVLATTDPQKVPATIKSRCVTLSFPHAKPDELLRALRRIAKAEKLSIKDDALALLAQLAEGSFRDGVKLLEQVSFHEGDITSDVVRSRLAVSDEGAVVQFLSLIRDHKTREALTAVSSVVSQGKDVKTFLIDSLHELGRILVVVVEGKPGDGWDVKTITRAIRGFSRAYAELRTSPIPELPIEIAVVELCAEDNTQVVEDRKQKVPSVVSETDENKKSIPGIKAAPIPGIDQGKPETQKDSNESPSDPGSPGLISLEKLVEHWQDFIAEMKPYNHSVAGVLRSSRPKAVDRGIVTIEAFYPFHQEKLSEMKTRDALSTVLKKLFGEKVRVEVVLGKK